MSSRLKFICSLLIISFLALMALPAWSQQQPALFHIEVEPTRHVLCTLNVASTVPNVNVYQWLALIPQPLDLPGQSLLGESLMVDGKPMTVNTDYDQSEQRRPVLSLVVDAGDLPDPHTLDVTATYEVSLESRKLVSGAPLSAPIPLSPGERAEYTLSSHTTDYKSKAFQKWLNANKLRRPSGETDLTYARRVFDLIREQFTYSYISDQDRRSSVVCWAASADCGGLSNLFVATLRQAKIPARIEIGRWAYSSDPDDVLQDMHVKSEFYADGIGWVPVEMSGAVSNKQDDASVYFGCDTGQFLSMSVDTDYVIDAQSWGTKHLLALQDIYLWSEGTGTYDGSSERDRWQVFDFPTSPASPSTVLTASSAVSTAPMHF
jgi:transglutaminase-like putative cysteine protease